MRSGSGARGSRLISSDGTVIEVYFSLTTTVTSKGTSNLSLIVTDLRELLQARHERDRAEHDSHVKNEFLAMLAHELRNPLGAIRSAVSVIDCVEATGSAATHAREVIARQIAHLSRLIDDLLDVERVASGKIRLDRHPLDMAEAVQRAVASVTAGAGLDRDDRNPHRAGMGPGRRRPPRTGLREPDHERHQVHPRDGSHSSVSQRPSATRRCSRSRTPGSGSRRSCCPRCSTCSCRGNARWTAPRAGWASA